MDGGTNIAKPMRSSCGMLLRTRAKEKGSFFALSGTWMTAKMAAAKPPMGRLM
jgi:hypothetical protein